MFSAASFETLASKYRDTHLYEDEEYEERFNLEQKRLVEAWFLYAFLEICERSLITPKFNLNLKDGKSWIDQTIETYLPYLKDFFSLKWSQHFCDKEGCGWAFISDGGMKPHRSLCAAKVYI